MINKLIAISY